MPGPLQGVRIVELTSVVLGPWACQLLADMGADVIKVEAPRGDSNRALGAARHPGMAALYLTCNRNKRSIVLDLKESAARQALKRLTATSDVFIHNNRPQAMRKLGLEYLDLKAQNPRLIYCGSYGYSKRGPYGELGALDDSIQAASGIAHLAELVSGEPRYMPTIVADKTTAITVVYAVLAALFHRERTGEGQELEVPMFETMVSFVMAEHLWGMSFVPPLGAPGYTRLMSRHRKPYRTRDGYVALLPYLDSCIVWLVAGEQIDQGHGGSRSRTHSHFVSVISSLSPVLSVGRSPGSGCGFGSRGSSVHRRDFLLFGQ